MKRAAEFRPTQLQKIINKLRKEGFKPLEEDPRRWRRVKDHKVQDALIKRRGDRWTYIVIGRNK